MNPFINFGSAIATPDDVFASLIKGISDSFWGIIGMGWITLLFLVAFIAGTYVLYSFTLMHNGRKAGLKDDWMAFVPFARTVYRLEMVGDPWWKMFLLGEWYFYLSLINVLIPQIVKGITLNVMLTINVIYIAGALAMHVLYRCKYFKAIRMKPLLGLLPLTFFACFLVPIDLLTAFSDLFSFRGKDAPPAPSGKASITALTGMFAGQEFPVAMNEDLVLGRDSSFCNIIIDQHADKVSRKHCAIRFDPSTGSYNVTDYSSNGTFIDGGSRLVANMPTPLTRGTIIALGSRENRFRMN